MSNKDYNYIRKSQLMDVNIMRPILIILLVLTHALAVYSGMWEVPEGIGDSILYKYIAKFLSGFRMQGIILIAGYVYSFQVNHLERNYTLKEMFFKKFKRLILPSLFFSLLYILCFEDLGQFFTVQTFVSLLSGKAHLWFLPMLFWCFLLMTSMSKFVNRHLYSMLAVVFIVSLLPLPIKFRIGDCLHYFIYFYLGYLLYLLREKIYKHLLKIKYIVYLALLYLLILVLYTEFNDWMLSIYYDHSLYEKVLLLIVNNFFKHIMAFAGLLLMYIIVNYFLLCKKIEVKTFMLKASGYSYGIYVFHQFLLEYLYYYTKLPMALGTTLLPIVSFILVVSISFVFTVITLKTRFGRFLIG